MQDFVQSEISQRMSKAAARGGLYKEQSFFLGVSANLVDAKFPKEEMVLVQGIIDAYFEEDGELVVVDYKTDRVERGAELISRYKVQMDYYTRALEQALGKKVKEVILYSLSLNEEVII
jgi:ATP-dependent helicase/nuclease subunit A